MTTNTKYESIAVLGGGSWGATLATVLAKNNHQVSVWEFNPEITKKLKETRRLSTLPNLVLPDSILVSNDISEVLKNKKIILSVTPSHTVRATFESAKKKNALSAGALIISASKGIENETGKTMEQVIEDVFPERGKIVILSGPSHAEEVALGKPVVLVAASNSQEAAAQVQTLFVTESVRVYTSNDPMGVELGGALKNVYAVACGVVDGLKLGDNTKAALMTRGLLEMTRLGKTMGAQPVTFFGLSGLGDLIVTCGSQHSRNRLLGEKIGSGKKLAEALAEMTMVAEGVNTTKSAYNLSRTKGVQMPIVTEMYEVLFQNKFPKDSIKDLMARQMGAEMEGLVL